MNDSPVLFLAGTTGSGKTALAVRLAERHGFEIISADSMQVYRGMEIGTAQPTADERRRAKFHVCGELDPSEPFNVKRFVELCDSAHRDIIARGRRPLYAGGTGLYLRALRWGLDGEEGRDAYLREGLTAEIEARGPHALHARLAEVDPVAAQKIGPADAIRIVRALEVHALTGKPISEQQTAWRDPVPRFPHRLVVLEVAPDLLEKRIAARTSAMLAAGWVEETQALLALGIKPSQHCFKALGYREILEHLEGRLSRSELEARIAIKTRQFAKRQRTWFRRETPAETLPISADSGVDPLEALENLLERAPNRQV